MLACEDMNIAHKPPEWIINLNVPNLAQTAILGLTTYNCHGGVCNTQFFGIRDSTSDAGLSESYDSFTNVMSYMDTSYEVQTIDSH